MCSPGRKSWVRNRAGDLFFGWSPDRGDRRFLPPAGAGCTKEGEASGFPRLAPWAMVSRPPGRAEDGRRGVPKSVVTPALALGLPRARRALPQGPALRRAWVEGVWGRRGLPKMP